MTYLSSHVFVKACTVLRLCVNAALADGKLGESLDSLVERPQTSCFRTGSALIYHRLRSTLYCHSLIWLKKRAPKWPKNILFAECCDDLHFKASLLKE